MSQAAPGDTRIAEIDGLRAVAMTMVVAQHCGLMPFGWTGVWLFFVISGFVITRTLMAEAADSRTASQRYRHFMLRRFFRIVPVYALYLAVAGLSLFLSGGRSGFADLPYLISFTYNWQMIYNFSPVADRFAPFGHLWTLSVEEQFYIFYPLLFLFVPARFFRPVLLTLVVLGPLIRLVTTLTLQAAGRTGDDLAFGVYASSLCQFDAFVIGALIASWERELKTRLKLADTLLKAAIALGIGYAAVIAAINVSGGGRGIDIVRNIYSGTIAGYGREVFTYVVVDVAAAALVVAALAGHWLLKPFGSPRLAWVGSISYGAYLFHALIIWLLIVPLRSISTGLSGRILLFVTAWTLTVAIAWLSYAYFEKPLMRFGRRLARDARESGSSSPAIAASRQ